MKLINFIRWDSQPYGEIGQSNPIRWMNLKPVDKDTYEPVSHWWMCKDFMNDAITSYWIKQPFKIYGFSVDPATFYAEGQTEMFLLLKNILPAWEHNMKVVNKKLKSMRFPLIKWEKMDDYYFITLPHKYLENTLNMSTITLWIRMANTNQPYDDMDKMITDGNNGSDAVNYQKTKDKPMNKLPEKYKDCVWSYGGTYECKRDGSSPKFMTSTMHNCGVVNFSWEV